MTGIDEMAKRKKHVVVTHYIGKGGKIAAKVEGKWYPFSELHMDVESCKSLVSLHRQGSLSESLSSAAKQFKGCCVGRTVVPWN